MSGTLSDSISAVSLLVASPCDNLPPSAPASVIIALQAQITHLHHEIGRLRDENTNLLLDARFREEELSKLKSDYHFEKFKENVHKRLSRTAESKFIAQTIKFNQAEKFISSLIEIGLHIPILRSAWRSVSAGDSSDPPLIDAIQKAAATPGTSWFRILPTVTTPQTPGAINAVSEEPCHYTNMKQVVSSWKAKDTSSQPLRHNVLPRNRERSRFDSNEAAIAIEGSLNPTTVTACSFDLRFPSALRLGLANTSEFPSVKPSIGTYDPSSGYVKKVEDISQPSSQLLESRSHLELEDALLSLERICAQFSSGSLGSLEAATDHSPEGAPASDYPVAREPLHFHSSTIHSTRFFFSANSDQSGPKFKASLKSALPKAISRLGGPVMNGMQMVFKKAPLRTLHSPCVTKTATTPINLTRGTKMKARVRHTLMCIGSTIA